MIYTISNDSGRWVPAPPVTPDILPPLAPENRVPASRARAVLSVGVAVGVVAGAALAIAGVAGTFQGSESDRVDGCFTENGSLSEGFDGSHAYGVVTSVDSAVSLTKCLADGAFISQQDVAMWGWVTPDGERRSVAIGVIAPDDLLVTYVTFS